MGRPIDFDDKDLGIMALLLIAIFSLIFMGSDSREIIKAIVSAIAGIVTGRRLDKRGSTQK